MGTKDCEGAKASIENYEEIGERRSTVKRKCKTKIEMMEREEVISKLVFILIFVSDEKKF
jgi:hypothetical protein